MSWRSAFEAGWWRYWRGYIYPRPPQGGPAGFHAWAGPTRRSVTPVDRSMPSMRTRSTVSRLRSSPMPLQFPEAV